MTTVDRKAPLLRIEDLTVHYGAAQALFGVDLAVGQGETVALVGANGAGKTSLLKAVMGLAPPSGGRIFLDGVEVTGLSPAAMAARGVALCPEGREMFGDLTVQGEPGVGDPGLEDKPAGAGPAPGRGLCPVPQAQRTGRPAEQHALGRGTADGGHGSGPHGPAPAFAPG